MKQRARIWAWRVIGNSDDACLFGRITEHPRQHDFHGQTQQTSRLLRVDFEKREAETLNTIYTLETE